MTKESRRTPRKNKGGQESKEDVCGYGYGYGYGYEGKKLGRGRGRGRERESERERDSAAHYRVERLRSFLFLEENCLNN